MSFDVLVKAVWSGLAEFQWTDAVDILIMAILLYRVLVLTRETRAYQVIKGIGIVFLLAVISDAVQLPAVSWLLNSLLVSGLVVIVVLFQPEIRRGLEHIGRGKILAAAITRVKPETSVVVREMHTAITDLARRQVGALIVIEQRTGLGEIIGTGTRIDGAISAPLIENIFEPNTPLHDGAVVIRDELIVAAACFLPLAEDITVARELGTRHRAALGISTVSDSITIVVSEETGVISFARDGKLVRYVDDKALTDLLESIFEGSTTSALFSKRRAKNEAEKH